MKPKRKKEQHYSRAMHWDKEGRCFEQVNNGPTERRPDLDYGTPNGDVLIDPWIQQALRESQG